MSRDRPVASIGMHVPFTATFDGATHASRRSKCITSGTTAACRIDPAVVLSVAASRGKDRPQPINKTADSNVRPCQETRRRRGIGNLAVLVEDDGEPRTRQHETGRYASCLEQRNPNANVAPVSWLT